jgi:hypothetical protein
MFRQFFSSKDIVKTILVFLVSLATGLTLANSTWAHGGGGGGGGGSAGSGSSSAGGSGNGGGMGHGGGNGAGHGVGFGFGHAGVGNPGHNALSTRSSHSQNTSHKGGNHHGRSLSSHSRSMHSLAQHHTAHSSKAYRVVQVDDTLPGKKKGFVDALPPGQELQADRGRALNPDTIHSDLDDIVTRGLPPGLELNLDRGKSLPPGWQAKVAPGTIVPDTDDALDNNDD